MWPVGRCTVCGTLTGSLADLDEGCKVCGSKSFASPDPDDYPAIDDMEKEFLEL